MATPTPLTAGQKWINLLKTALVPLAVTNLYLMPFDLRFLSFFQQSETSVDDAICLTAISILAMYSFPAGRLMTKSAQVLFFAPLFLIILGSLWYDWGVSFPSSTAEGIEDTWPMWLPQYWVRPGKIAGKSLQAAALSAFANNQALTLLISGKFTMLDRVTPWIVSTRPRRIVVTICLICGIMWLKKTALEYPLTFASKTVNDAGKLQWWTEIRQGWANSADPMASKPRASWSFLIRLNIIVATTQTLLFFRMRGGGVFYAFDINTWKSSIVIEPSSSSILKAEDYYGRAMRLIADRMNDHNRVEGKEDGYHQKDSTEAVKADMEQKSTRRWWHLPVAVNIGLFGIIFLPVADLVDMPRVFDCMWFYLKDERTLRWLRKVVGKLPL